MVTFAGEPDEPDERADALTDFTRCPAFCVDHHRSCNVTGVHSTTYSQLLHVCNYGRWGHNFFVPEATT